MYDLYNRCNPHKNNVSIVFIQNVSIQYFCTGVCKQKYNYQLCYKYHYLCTLCVKCDYTLNNTFKYSVKCSLTYPQLNSFKNNLIDVNVDLVYSLH